MKEHESYKESDIPWLKSLPSHWATKRAKYLFSLLDRPVEVHYEVITCFRDGVVTLRKNRRQTGFTESLTETGYQGIKAGDLVIHQMDAFAGSVGVSDSDGKSTPVYSVCSPKEELSTYYYAYIIREMARTNYILSLAKGIRQRSTDFRFPTFARCLLPVPPVEEQNAIVAYLDKKCAEIDKLVSRRQSIIERLKELKQSIIAEAVTKGLNPDVPMKDSGIAWLGEVPQHWNIERLQWHLREIKEINSPIKTNRVLSLTNKKGVIPYEEKGNQGNKAKASHDEYKLAYPDTLVMNSMNVIIGSVGICNYFGCVSPVYYIFKTAGETMLSFVNYVFQTTRFQKELRRHAKGILEIRLRLSSDDILKRLVAFPPLHEQRSIVAYLDKKCAEIDELVARQEQIIEKLKELKTSTIAHVVTGKVDVRDVI